MNTTVMSLILSIAISMGVPEYFVLSIAIEENSTLNPLAVSKQNNDGSYDYGVLQLNGRYLGSFIEEFWDKSWKFEWYKPFDNIYLGCRIIKSLMGRPDITTFYGVAISYNAGCKWLINGSVPPASSIEYAQKVLKRWEELDSRNFSTLINKKGGRK